MNAIKSIYIPVMIIIGSEYALYSCFFSFFYLVLFSRFRLNKLHKPHSHTHICVCVINGVHCPIEICVFGLINSVCFYLMSFYVNLNLIYIIECMAQIFFYHHSHFEFQNSSWTDLKKWDEKVREKTNKSLIRISYGFHIQNIFACTLTFEGGK